MSTSTESETDSGNMFLAFPNVKSIFLPTAIKLTY